MSEDDPTFDMLTFHEFVHLPGGDVERGSVPLDLRAAALREYVADASRDESSIETDWQSGVVAFSTMRGMVVAELLRELAERLAPGCAVGPMRCGDAMGGLAGREPGPGSVDAVVVGEARAEVLAALLRELSTRLRPGLAVGPIRSDGSLRAFVEELADDLFDRSWSRPS